MLMVRAAVFPLYVCPQASRPECAVSELRVVPEASNHEFGVRGKRFKRAKVPLFALIAHNAQVVPCFGSVGGASVQPRSVPDFLLAMRTENPQR